MFEGAYFIHGNPKRFGLKALLTSPDLSSGSRCLSFYYYASGNIARLLDYKAAKFTKNLWRPTSSDSSDWTRVELSIPQGRDNYKVSICDEHGTFRRNISFCITF